MKWLCTIATHIFLQSQLLCNLIIDKIYYIPNSLNYFCNNVVTLLHRRKSRSATPPPRRRRSRSPAIRRRRSRSPTPRRHKRQRSKSSSLSPLPKSRSPSLTSTEHKNALEKLKKEEEERKRYTHRYLCFQLHALFVVFTFYGIYTPSLSSGSGYTIESWN